MERPRAFLRGRGARDAPDPRRSRACARARQACRWSTHFAEPRRWRGAAGRRTPAVARSRTRRARRQRAARRAGHRTALLRRHELRGNRRRDRHLQGHRGPRTAVRARVARRTHRRAMNDTAPRIKILFDEALDLDADARRAWLDALRAREPEVAARIERLLALDAQRADPFGRAIDSLRSSLDFDPAAWLDRELGGFRLLRVLGEGGMGAVYLAERQMRDFQQLVALKLLRGRWLERSALDRFAEERRILARLHHPNIATLIDAGATDDGRPFLVMEYIDGVPLLEY